MLRILIVSVVISMMVACSGMASSERSDIQSGDARFAKLDPEKGYQQSADEAEAVDIALAEAKAEGKLGLIVMGADWCHDSRAFIKLFNEKDVQEILRPHYVPLIVDVGFLDQGKALIERFGMPVIYGTPTVLIVEPTTGNLVNADDMHRWRDAYKIEKDEAISYFSAKSSPKARAAAMAQPAWSATQQRLFAEIDAFEQAHAERLYRAYDIIGPMLAMKRKKRPDEFERYWDQVRDLRYQITEDLGELRMEVRGLSVDETDYTLELPTYPPFEWE